MTHDPGSHTIHATRASQNAGDVESPTSPAQDGARCLVVMYHYVHDTEPETSYGMCGLTGKDFRKQIQELLAVLEPTEWPHFYGWMQGRCELPSRSFLLTFDDGLADHVRTVVPILEDIGVRGTFFVPGAVLAQRRMLCAHAVHVLFAALGDTRLEEEVFAELSQRRPDTDWPRAADAQAARQMYHYESELRGRIKFLMTVVLPAELRKAVVDALFERHVGSMARWAKDWYLQWEDLRLMQAHGHTVGGHGFAHEPYTRLDAAQRRDDMLRVAAVLREGLGPDLRPFSYPFGSVNQSIAMDCRRAGFAQAFSTECRWISRTADPWQLPRVDTIDVERHVNGEPHAIRSPRCAR